MYKIGFGMLRREDLAIVPPADVRYDIEDLREIPTASHVNLDIDEVDHIAAYECGLDLDPPYQRGHVWDTAKESAYIGYMLKGGKGPPIWVNRYEDARTGGKNWLGEPVTVIDGKQRLTALIRWVQGEIPAVLNDLEIWYKELSKIDRRFLPKLDVIYVNMTIKDQMKLYLNLNGGVAHTAEELDRVRELLNK